MTAGPKQGSEPEDMDPYPDVDLYALAEQEAAAAAEALEDELLIEYQRQNAAADPTRGGGPKPIGEILRPEVDGILRRSGEKE